MHTLARGAAVTLLATSALAWAGTAEARPEARLVYLREGPASTCPEEKELVAAIAERLGYVPFTPSAPRVVMVTVDRQSNRWRGKVQAIDGGEVHGRRELFSDSLSCSDLAASLALSVALLLDPDRALGIAPAEPAPAPEPATPAAPASPQLVDRHEDPFAPAPDVPSRGQEGPTDPRPEWSIGVLGAGSVGSEPSPVPAGGAFVEARWNAFRLGLDARADLPSTTPESEGVGVRVWLAQGSLVPCYARGLVAACGVASAGAISGEAQGAAARAHRATSLYGALGGRFEATLPVDLGPIALRLYGELVVPLSQPTFTVSDARVWTLPPLAGAGGVRVALRLP